MRKHIEPETPVASGPAPPSAPLPNTTPMEEDGVSMASPTSVVPPPPLPETKSEVDLAEHQQKLLEEHQEERQEEQQQQPPPPTGSEELLTPAEPPPDSKTG